MPGPWQPGKPPPWVTGQYLVPQAEAPERPERPQFDIEVGPSEVRPMPERPQFDIEVGPSEVRPMPDPHENWVRRLRAELERRRARGSGGTPGGWERNR